jgi:glycosyltransferase involved in cell wall biosynthesis
MASDDETRNISLQYTPHVYTHERIPDFGRARQYGVDQATREWLLIIDADEMVPASLARHLQQLVIENEIDVVAIPRVNYSLGRRIRYSGWWPDYQIRFARRNALCFSGDVHSGIGVAAGAKLVDLPLVDELALIHFNYHDVADFVGRMNRYTSLHVQEQPWRTRTTSPGRICVEFFVGFLGRYLFRQGFRDGMQGLMLSLLMGVYRMVLHMKVWERQHNLLMDDVERIYCDERQKVLATFAVVGSQSS